MGILDRVLLIRVNLPPLEMYCLFHLASLLRNLSSTPTHTLAALYFAPKGNPKYSASREPILQPNSRAKLSSFYTLPTSNKELLSKLVFNQKRASNQAKIQPRYAIWSTVSFQKTRVSSANSKCVICLSVPFLPLNL